MTTHSSAPGVRDNFDTGPLSWVMGEIREALTRSKTSIREAVVQDSDTQPTSLRHAKAYLHQAHGALQIVDVDGVALITDAIERIFDRLETQELTLNAAVAQAIGMACQAVTEYLEELLAGAPHQPVTLFPYYKTLMDLFGNEKAHPSDLFFPNFAIRPVLPLSERHVGLVDYAVLRQKFEKALLPFLKNSEQAVERANAAAMEEVIAEIERHQNTLPSRTFWWVMRGFADVVASGGVKSEVYVKQLFARINLQLRRLS
jgi:chemosensory pili system protein ChpA (sensor histidine kinase/response regulator)